MPVPPKFPFHKVTCMSCGWSYVSVQISDVISAPYKCGRCGATPLTHSVPTAAQVAMAKPAEFILYLIRQM